MLSGRVQRDGTAQEIADRLHSAAIHLLRRVRRTDVLTGVSPAQLSALSLLMSGPRTIGELAALEHVRPPTMSRLVHDMEHTGLVQRERDRVDGRVVWVRWTRAGSQVLARGRELRVDALREQIARLDAEHQAALLRAVELIEGLVDKFA